MSHPVRIILIDDDEEDLYLFLESITSVVFDVRYQYFLTCADALVHLNTPGSEKPQYIFVDLHMPGTDGLDCLADIRKIPGLDQLPIILFSRSIREETIGIARRAGASAVAEKPGTTALLTAKLNTILSSGWEEQVFIRF